MRGNRNHQGNSATFVIVLIGLFSVGVVMATARTSAADQAAQNSRVFSGVVEGVDVKAMKIAVKTDTGKTVDLEVTKPDLLKDIDKGDRITVEVNEKEMATKIMKNIPIPELKGPESEATPAPEKQGLMPGGR